MKAHVKNTILQFKFPAGTSRGVLTEKPSTYLFLEEDGMIGIGECSTIPNLSIDPQDSYLNKLQELCHIINNDLEMIDLSAYPSIQFGLETAYLDLQTQGSKILFNNSFSRGEKGIPINGLVWMGKKDFMQEQIKAKINEGYSCIKMKIGALDFNTELEIIANLRKYFPKEIIEIRLDANGAFSPTEAIMKLQLLSKYHIHSIEQPVKNCIEWRQKFGESPIPFALDEELIGIHPNDRETLLLKAKPNYIILKPSLLGGFEVCEDWISLAEKHQIKWWATSALESNIGLNAIAQWTASLNNDLPQGLGTGQLFRNNIDSPLEIKKGELFYNTTKEWDI